MKRLFVAVVVLSMVQTAAYAAQPAPSPQAQQAQQPQSVQDQLIGVYTTLNLNLAKQLDAANTDNQRLRKELEDAKKLATEQK